MIGLVLFFIWMSLWGILCLVFFYLDKDYYHSRKILPNLPLELASEEDIIEMVEEKLEEKKANKKATYNLQQKYPAKLHHFTIKQLLIELAFRMRNF